MSGTRASTIRAALIAAVEAATVDGQSHSHDKFHHVDDGQDVPAAMPDRMFSVRLIAQPIRISASSCDQFQAAYTIEVAYNASQDAISDRIADDSERLYLAIDTLDTSVPGIERIDIEPVGVIDDGTEQIRSAFNVAVTYRLASAVVTA